eukprot:TRINITY_DN7781_c0_g1_i1.p2 TRINITY_DN7781_c0_g1~~TRINITY_DN7781_c0_g1_i1.p2  ORF type:complete len:100 (+),score=16.59 TRINITY_DN7781_c0_g1_i1:1885-2184(+)
MRGLKSDIEEKMKICRTIQEAYKEAIVLSVCFNNLTCNNVNLKKERPSREEELILLKHLFQERIMSSVSNADFSPYADFSPQMRRKKKKGENMKNFKHE